MEDLKNHIQSVPFKQLEVQVQSVKSSIKQESKRYERLTYQLSLTNHQLSLYTSESIQIQEKLNSTLALLTKETISSLRQIKAPVSIILDLCSNLLLILDIKDRSWQSFRSISKNFAAFKNLMASATNDQLPEHAINEVLIVWKNQAIIRSKLLKINLGACLVLDWVVQIVELNVKTEIISNSQKRVPELERMIRRQTKTLSELTTENVSIEEMLNRTKQNADEFEQEQDDCSELSLTSKPYSSFKDEERVVFQSTVHRGTASGGLLYSRPAALCSQNNFPNFNSEVLYGEIPVHKLTEEEPIVFEGKGDAIGCCRMKFFCF